MEIKGIIKYVSDVQEGEGKKGSWAKRTIVVTEAVGQYPNEIVLSMFKSGEHVEYAKDKFTFKEGDLVRVEYNTRANEHEGKWYGDNSIWKIERSGEDVPVALGHEEETDDLPF